MRKTGVTGVLLAAAASLFAQDADPPSRVARLNYLNGSVSFRPGSVEEWTAATLNYPLTTADHLWTDPGASTEMHIGSTAIRMASETAISFLALDDQVVQLSLTQGSLNIRLRSLADGETYEIDTPNVAITLLRPGDYRVDADGDRNSTAVTVRLGDAEMTGAGLALTVHARQSARITGMDELTQELGMAPPADDFDRWCEDRSLREDRVESTRYIPPEMTGYEDLDAYGVWTEEPGYGWCWYPRVVSVGWAPYRFGRWVWVDPWGWTWVDEAPWGFAPFHYGRWAHASGRWIWIPGPRTLHARPVYAPALVVFVGGPHFGGGIAAWFPLGPGEMYRPHYRTSEVYLRNLNARHVTNISTTNLTIVNQSRYVNQRVDGAVTAMNNRDFVAARHAARTSLSVNARDVAEAPVIGAAPPVVPRRESVLGGMSGAPAPRAADRIVVVRRTPPPAPIAFSARERVLEANQGRPLDPAQLESIRGSAPARAPMVRPVPARTPTARPVVINGDFAPRQLPSQNATPDDGFRNQRPRRTVEVQPQIQPPQPQPAQVEAPRPVAPARVQQPRPEPAQRQEQPRIPAQPRTVEQPRRADPPHVEPPRPEPARRMQQPPQEAPRSEPRSERPPAAERRQDVRREPQPQRREAQPEEKKDDAPARAGRKGN